MSKPFELGKTYRTQAGDLVTIIEVKNDLPGYECVRGDDNPETYTDNRGMVHTLGWRYNRDSDRGRCPGSAHDFSDPRNLVPDSEVPHVLLAADRYDRTPEETCNACRVGYGAPLCPLCEADRVKRLDKIARRA